MEKNKYFIESINKTKLEALGFKEDLSYNELYGGNVCLDQMRLLIPKTFRFRYYLYVGTHTVLEGLVFLSRGPEAFTPEEFIERMTFKAPEAAQYTQNLIDEMIKSEAIILNTEYCK
ncbi:MAG: hypothetical protein PHN69_02820 [Candidatus Pacebacteria bacterium]|nr:hypothetical protein [Candidatus Paceibacterota bacterium]